MESQQPLDDCIGRVDDAPEGVSEAGYHAAPATLQSKPARDDPTPDDSMSKEQSDPDLNRQLSLPLSLEPPPVIRRPPTLKSSGFGFRNLSLFSWNRTEQKDVPSCSRSTHRSYTHDTSLRFLGFSITTSLHYKTSDSGLDIAIESVRIVSIRYRTNRIRNICPALNDGTCNSVWETLFKRTTKQSSTFVDAVMPSHLFVRSLRINKRNLLIHIGLFRGGLALKLVGCVTDYQKYRQDSRGWVISNPV
jgi:hypothetical protein